VGRVNQPEGSRSLCCGCGNPSSCYETGESAARQSGCIVPRPLDNIPDLFSAAICGVPVLSEVFCYSGFGLVIESEIELPELGPGQGEPDVSIRLGSVPGVRRKTTPSAQFAFNVIGAAFHISNGREIVVDPRPDVDQGALRVVLLGRVMAFLLRQRGWLPVHASGIVIDGQGILLAGRSGSGKSTTAAAFHVRGHVVITDDVAPVRVIEGRAFVQAVGSRLRLLTDACALLANIDASAQPQADKYTYTLQAAQISGFFPLRRIYMLEDGEPLRAEPISRLAAAVRLSDHSFVRHRNTVPESLEDHLRDCTAIAGVVALTRLVRPLSLESLHRLVQLVEDDLAADHK
jgi:hypothetical protein